MKNNKQSISLSDLLGVIRESVELIFADSLWITAEVLSISSGAHKYLDIVEYNDRREEVAKGRAMIWKADAGMLTQFERATGKPLTSGMKILFNAKPSFHPVYGLSLTISQIDATYTIGDMEAKLERMRVELKSKGWWDMNRNLPRPTEFCNVAVIAPANAAGLGDFRVYADKLEETGICKFTYFSSLFQGKEAPNNIIDQMIEVNNKSKEEDFDCLAIIRGGGDKAGLYHLNDYRLCASVCRFPIPVFVGIGHEQDKVILDEVANGRFATPSLLISHILQQVVKNARQAQSDWEIIQSSSKRSLQRALNKCESLATGIRSESYRGLELSSHSITSSIKDISHATERLSAHCKTIRDSVLISAREKTLSAQASIEGHVSQVLMHNPLRIMERGYAVVKSGKGYVTGVTQLQEGDSITLQLKDGVAHSTINAITKGNFNE